MIAASAREDIEATTLRKVAWRLVPFLALAYFAAFIDRVNVSFAALQMNRDLGFSPFVYGLGAGILFLGYCLFEVPSNLILHRVGGRRWLARMMLTWGIIAGAMALVRGATGFFVLRFLLGVAEAGFFPGVVYYLTYWVPAAHRARLLGAFMLAIPISTAVGGPLSGALLKLDGLFGLAGWQWLFLFEAVPSLILGIAALSYLRDRPHQARWLTPEQQHWLAATLEAERCAPEAHGRLTLLAACLSSRILALSVCYFCAEIGLYGVIFWLPQILSGVGIAESSIGYVVALPYAFAALAMWWWSRHSDLTAERRWHIALAALLSFCGLATSAYTADPRLAVVAFTLGAAGTLAILPIFWTLPTAVLSGELAAAAIAIINSLGNLGGFAGPYLMGWIKSASGAFTYALLLVACGVLLSGVIALIVGQDLMRRPASV